MQTQSITCESSIEHGYYDVKKCRLKLDDICIHYGTLGSPDFLFGTEEFLREKRVSGGFECRPICKDCFEKRKIIVHRGKKNTTQERKEKEQKKKEKQ